MTGEITSEQKRAIRNEAARLNITLDGYNAEVSYSPDKVIVFDTETFDQKIVSWEEFERIIITQEGNF